MAIVLALVIIGWLVAFALGAKSGFNDTPAATQKSPSAKFTASKSTISQESASAA